MTKRKVNKERRLKNNKIFYVNSDGNGGFNISKGALTFIAVMLTMFGIIGSSVYYYGVLNNRVDNLELNSGRIPEENKVALQDINIRLNSIEQQLSVSGVRMDDVVQDIQEIKQDIKDLKNQVNQIDVSQ